MAFRDYQKHCKECKRDEPCGGYHVYVMILKPTILEKKKFQEKNPDYVKGKPCYYVGKTEHHPRCRQSMHQNYSKDKPTQWKCFCHISPRMNDYEGFWNNPSFFVLGHTDGFLKQMRLKPSSTSADAIKEERRIRDKLREQGFGVWAGHHDTKNPTNSDQQRIP